MAAAVPEDISEKRELPSLKASEALYRQAVVRPAAGTKFLHVHEDQDLDMVDPCGMAVQRDHLTADHREHMHCFVS